MSTIIFIPYRRRETHLKYFLENSVPLLQKYMKNVKIVVVEQVDGKLFNRGKLLNVGFKEYKNECKYAVTHDVDINPKEKAILEYYIQDVDDNTFKGILTSPCDTLAPIFKVKMENLFKINGFPNDIWGWGVEDKAIQNRVEFYKFNKETNLINYTNHARKEGNIYDTYFLGFNDIDDRDERNDAANNFLHYRRWKGLNDSVKNVLIVRNGLNSLKYKMIRKDIILEGVVERILVAI